MNKTMIRDLFELTKPRICMLALMMATLGFCVGNSGPMSMPALSVTLFGIGLVGACCGALNMYLERDIDALMFRTRNRPLPAGRLRPRTALIVGYSTGILGTIILAVFVNSLTAILGILTAFSYLAVYTPSKRTSSLSTLVGAIPGAMPPLMGFTASYGSLGPEGLLLFAILFVWQIPHFLAIAWVYREDYARGGFPILSVVDIDGVTTVKQVVVYLLTLVPLTLVPSMWGVTGRYYFYGAILLGLVYLASGISLAIYRSKPYARRLFLVSIIYLPVLGILMVWDRTL